MGLSSATDKQKEAAWRVEFEALGEQSVLKNVKQGAIRNEAKRQAAFCWLSEQAQLRDRREAWAAELAWLALLCVNCGGTYRRPGYVDCAPLKPLAASRRLGQRQRLFWVIPIFIHSHAAGGSCEDNRIFNAILSVRGVA